MKLVRAAVIAAFAAACALASAQVPNPTVTGPIPATVRPGDSARDYPFFSSYVDLAAHGYVEEEFFFSGSANTYQVTNPLQTANVATIGNVYKTRMVVRRPADAANFNGIVLVEWLNVTNQLDMENTVYQIDQHILRSGYAWVGVSVQRIGVNRLRTWNPSRYGTLDVSKRLAPAGGVEEETFRNDQLQYDVFSQAVQAIRQPSGTAPLGPLQPHKVIATGHSQSARALIGYLNQVHQLANVVDGYALHGSLGNAVRSDPTVPVAKVLSESDVQLFNEYRVRRADDDLYRSWEVAGTSHNDRRAYVPRVLLQLRDTGSNVEASLNCTFMPPGSAVPFHHVMGAAVDHMARWVSSGTPMPSAPHLEMTIDPVTGRVQAIRDELGIARGGIRLAAVEVPIAQSSGVNSGPGSCDRWGYSDPLPASTIQRLYGNHGQYVSRVRDVTTRNLAAGYIVQRDAAATVNEAARSMTGR